MEETNDALDFLMALNGLLAIHIYNTKSSQNCVACFGLNLAMTWFLENIEVYQLGILFDLIGFALVQSKDWANFVVNLMQVIINKH